MDANVQASNRYDGMAIAIDLVFKLPIIKHQDSYLSYPNMESKENFKKYRDCADALELHSRVCGEAARDIALNWAADCLIAIGQYKEALSMLPSLKIGGRASVSASNRLCVKIELNEDVEAREILTIFGPKLSNYGRANINAIETYVATTLSAIKENERRYIVGEWMGDAYESQHGFSLFSGHPSHIAVTRPRGFSFTQSSIAEKFCNNLIRLAENTYREDQGLPRVGEGWVAETILFYSIKERFPKFEVLQHFSPDWLGRQHFDVYLPQIHVALEYQGLQHDQPIDFFGGIEAYQKTVKRDRKKMMLAKRNSTYLIYVREGYDIDEIVNQINRQVD